MTERGEIHRIGAKAQKNSGRGEYQKGDAKLGPFLLDFKEASRSFTLNQKVWSKICTDSIRSGGEPALVVILGEETKTRLWIMTEEMALVMMQAYERALEEKPDWLFDE